MSNKYTYAYQTKVKELENLFKDMLSDIDKLEEKNKHSKKLGSDGFKIPHKNFTFDPSSITEKTDILKNGFTIASGNESSSSSTNQKFSPFSQQSADLFRQQPLTSFTQNNSFTQNTPFNQQPISTFPQQPVSTFPQQPVSTFPQQPVSTFPQQPVSTFPQQHVSTFPQQPVSTFPQQPVSTFPQQHISTFPQQPVSAFPQQPISTFPQQPISTFPQQPISTFPNPSTNFGSENKMIHDGIHCNNCGANPIQGVRYKCTYRQNYDLCEKCELIDNTGYPLIKIKDSSLLKQLASHQIENNSVTFIDFNRLLTDANGWINTN